MSLRRRVAARACPKMEDAIEERARRGRVFGGEYQDATGFIYLVNRYYGAVTGEFLDDRDWYYFYGDEGRHPL